MGSWSLEISAIVAVSVQLTRESTAVRDSLAFPLGFFSLGSSFTVTVKMVPTALATPGMPVASNEMLVDT
jgi:hypothetical protein